MATRAVGGHGYARRSPRWPEGIAPAPPGALSAPLSGLSKAWKMHHKAAKASIVSYTQIKFLLATGISPMHCIGRLEPFQPHVCLTRQVRLQPPTSHSGVLATRHASTSYLSAR